MCSVYFISGGRGWLCGVYFIRGGRVGCVVCTSSKGEGLGV